MEHEGFMARDIVLVKCLVEAVNSFRPNPHPLRVKGTLRVKGRNKTNES